MKWVKWDELGFANVGSYRLPQTLQLAIEEEPSSPSNTLFLYYNHKKLLASLLDVGSFWLKLRQSA